MKVYSVADNIISPLGFDTAQNFSALSKTESGIVRISDSRLYPEGFFGAQIGLDLINQAFDSAAEQARFTLLEQLFILSIQNVLETVPGIDKNKLLLILSTTKGNIDLLNNKKSSEIGAERVEIAQMASTINQYFGLPHAPVTVSNACISGISALLVGKRMIQMGLYDHVLVAGGDILSEFTISGFQCLKAISDEPCRPYDAERKGVTLGEACGTLLLSKDPGLCNHRHSLSILAGGGQSNDANHISGPSRTGKGLKIAIEKALKSAQVEKEDIAYINAHGTATSFNDEMEAIAFDDLGMQDIPLNSLKGYFGHTLGAAGLIETIMSIWQLNEDLLLKTEGYEKLGVSRKINVLSENQRTEGLHYILKTASGFGGCNAALVIEKEGLKKEIKDFE